MSNDKIAEIRARHEAGPIGHLPVVAFALANADRATLLAEVERLNASNERLLRAIGLATTAVPDMQIDVRDPVGMMRRVVAEVERLREALKGIDALNPDVPDALVASDLRAIVAQMGDLAVKTLEVKP